MFTISNREAVERDDLLDDSTLDVEVLFRHAVKIRQWHQSRLDL